MATSQTQNIITAPPRITVIDPRQPEKARLRVAAYARVSSDSEDQINSYIAQVDFYTKYISSKGDWELVDIYHLQDNKFPHITPDIWGEIQPTVPSHWRGASV